MAKRSQPYNFKAVTPRLRHHRKARSPLHNFIRGAGSLVEIIPDPNRRAADFSHLKPPPVEDALYGYWQNVGNYFLLAMERARLEQEDKED